jgi:predicted CopG family antitoxin
MQVTISQEVVELLNDVKKDGQTVSEIVEQAIKLGCYQLEYRRGDKASAARKAYQARKREEDKLYRAFYKKAQQDPDLAVKVGLGTRHEL